MDQTSSLRKRQCRKSVLNTGFEKQIGFTQSLNKVFDVWLDKMGHSWECWRLCGMHF